MYLSCVAGSYTTATLSLYACLIYACLIYVHCVQRQGIFSNVLIMCCWQLAPRKDLTTAPYKIYPRPHLAMTLDLLHLIYEHCVSGQRV